MTDQVEPESEVERTLGTLASLNPAYVLDHAEQPPAAPITIDELYRTHRMQMVRLAILLVDDISSAEDVVQEAFTGLYRNWGGLRDRNAAIGYLRTAVVNGSRSMLRRRRTARAYVPPDPGTARSAESLAMLSTEHQAVVSALADLAPRQREVLVLRYYGGLSEAEIAEATGLSKGTVKSTASRAVAKLGDIMRTTRRRGGRLARRAGALAGAPGDGRWREGSPRVAHGRPGHPAPAQYQSAHPAGRDRRVVDRDRRRIRLADALGPPHTARLNRRRTSIPG
jgi:RNA polymerase sigma-70 factor (sigma-E family)